MPAQPRDIARGAGLALHATCSPDLVVVHSPVGGGHKAAALALAEAARARGLRSSCWTPSSTRRALLGRAYLGAHLTAQGGIPALYGSAYFDREPSRRRVEPIRRGIDHVAWAGLVARVVELAPRAVIATHHLPLLVLGRARRKGRLAVSARRRRDRLRHARGVGREGARCAVRPAAATRRRMRRRTASRPSAPSSPAFPVRPGSSRSRRVRDPAPGEPLRVLVTSGGFGVGPIRAIVRSFAGVRDVELTVVCGNADGSRAA